MKSAIIEVAINGVTSKDVNPNVPRSPDEIAADALRCLEHGAAIIHNHIEDIRLTGEAAAERYAEGWRPILSRRSDAILCPTTTFAEDVNTKVAHLVPCARSGARMGSIDTGSVNIVSTASDGGPGSMRFDYVNGYDELDVGMAALAQSGLGPSIAIYDPSFLRAALAYHRCGRLPPGAMIKLYFGGTYDLLPHSKDGPSHRPAISFGLPPTAKALDVYLEMLEGSGLEWSVAVLGGDAVASGITGLALERGGHVRVGLEDYAGEDTPTNLALLEGALAECERVGRAPATCADAATILALPAR